MLASWIIAIDYLRFRSASVVMMQAYGGSPPVLRRQTSEASSGSRQQAWAASIAVDLLADLAVSRRSAERALAVRGEPTETV